MTSIYIAYTVLVLFISSKSYIFPVLTMEAQADALNQLFTDNLEGKVIMIILIMVFH